MNKKWMSLIIAIVIMLLGTRYYMSTKPIYVGFSSGLSGQWSQLGVQVRNGVLLAIDDINTQGGIKGRKLIPVVMDSKNNNDNTSELLKTMDEKKINFFIGFSVSSMTPSVHKIMDESNILIISPTMSTNNLTGIDDHFIRVCNASVEETNIIINTLKNQSQKDFVLTYDVSNKPYTEPMRDILVEKSDENGLTFIREYPFNSQNVDYDALTKSISKENASHIIIFASGVDTAEIAQRLALLNSKAQLYSAAWATTDDLLQSGGQAIEGMNVSGLYDIASKSPRYLDFKHKMIDNYNDSPSFPEIFGYESIMILREGILAANSSNPSKVKEAIIQQRHFQGLQQAIEIDEFGDAHRPYYLYKVQNGEFVSNGH